MKKIILTITLVTVIVFLLAECKKKKPEAKPQETSTIDNFTYNAELQSSKDISFATMVICDLDMLGSFLGENIFFDNYFVAISGNQGVPSFFRDTLSKQFMASFNKTFCKDGKTREGSVFFNFRSDPINNPSPNPNAQFYRDFGFTARVTLADYKVDGWLIKLFDAAKPAFIQNKIASATFDPSTTNLTWEIRGKFLFLHPTDSLKNIVWDGTLIKTLTNTSDPIVFAKSKQTPINWKLAKVEYAGTVTGKTGNGQYVFRSLTKAPIKRDFTCSFVTQNSPSLTAAHPFIGGAPTFTISNFHPRTINYGPDNTCDNTGTVSFKSETHIVTFE